MEEKRGRLGDWGWRRRGGDERRIGGSIW